MSSVTFVSVMSRTTATPAFDFAAVIFQRPYIDADKHPVRFLRVSDVQLDPVRGLAAHRSRKRQFVSGIGSVGSGDINAEPFNPFRLVRTGRPAAHHLFGGWIEQNHFSAIVGHQNAVTHAVQNRSQDFRLLAVSRLRTRQRLLLLRHDFRRLLPLADFLGIGGGLQHRYFEIGRLPGLGDIRMDLAVVDGANQRVDVHVARDENPRGVAYLARFCQELPASEIGHSLVGQNHGDLRILEKLHRFHCVGADHDVKIIFQQGMDRLQDLRLVIHHQHCRLIDLFRHTSLPIATGIFSVNSVPSPVLVENSIDP